MTTFKFGVQLEGVREFNRALNNFSTFREKAKEIVAKNGAEMQQKTQEYAPVDTGYLKRNISLTIGDSGNSATVESKTGEGKENYAFYQEFGTRYQPGTPHVKPAFDQQKEKFKEDFKRMVKDI